MNRKHAVFVCTTCASTWQDGKRVGVSGGQILFDRLSQLYKEWQLAPEFALQAVECMSACNSPCVVTFAAEGKYTYVFGTLTAEDSAAAVLDCASKYHVKSDGLLPWSERPEPLKKGIVARIPPIDARSGQI
jgi:predicted metal-binding protein